MQNQQESITNNSCISISNNSRNINEAAATTTVPSPAPMVVKGGDHEFVKVSHLGSVEVKAVFSASGGGGGGGCISGRRIAMNLTSKKNSSSSSFSTATATATATVGYKNDNDDDDDNSNNNNNNNDNDDNGNHLFEAEKVAGKKKEKGKNRKKEKEKKEEKDDEVILLYDDESVGNIMDEIIKSPYESGGMNAEKGEPIFQEMKHLLSMKAEHRDDDNNNNDYDDYDGDDGRGGMGASTMFVLLLLFPRTELHFLDNERVIFCILYVFLMVWYMGVVSCGWYRTVCCDL